MTERPELYDEPDLSDQQRQSIEHLIAGKTKKAAADAVGVTPNTMSRWHREAEFVAALNARWLDVQVANVERLRGMVEKALAVFEGALDDANPKVRMQAAMQILQMARLTQLPALSQLTKPERVAAQWEEEAMREDVAHYMNITPGYAIQDIPEARGIVSRRWAQRNQRP